MGEKDPLVMGVSAPLPCPLLEKRGHKTSPVKTNTVDIYAFQGEHVKAYCLSLKIIFQTQTLESNHREMNDQSV